MADINWEAEDKKYIWHPAMQMKDNEVFPPVVVDHGKGVYLYDTHGKEYLDIISSWWCNLLGHCNPEINEALKKQVDELEHVIFTNFTTNRLLNCAGNWSLSCPRDSQSSPSTTTAPPPWKRP